MKFLYLIVTIVVTAINTAAINEIVEPIVVSLGDSYGAGTGIHTKEGDYDDPSCLAEYDTIPGGFYASGRGLKHVVTACSGDENNDTLAQWDDLLLRVPGQVQNGFSGSVLLFSTGGNSLRTNAGDYFETFLLKCLLSPACHVGADNQMANLDTVADELLNLYTQVVEQAPNATIRVIGYPKQLNSWRFWCFIPGFRVQEANHIDEIVGALSDRTKEVVETVKANYPNVDIEFVDVRPYYRTGACHPFPNREVRDFNARLLPVGFHPKQRGYDKNYEAFLDSIL